MDKIWQLVDLAPGAMLSKRGTTKSKILTDPPLEISSAHSFLLTHALLKKID